MDSGVTNMKKNNIKTIATNLTLDSFATSDGPKQQLEAINLFINMLESWQSVN